VSREGTVGVREAAEVRTREALRQRAAGVRGRDGSLSLERGAVSRRVSSYVVDKALPRQPPGRRPLRLWSHVGGVKRLAVWRLI